MKLAAFLAAVAFSLTASLAPSASAQKGPPEKDPIDRAMELIGPDPSAARRLVEPLAEAGHAEAMNMLAILVENDGPDWKADPARSVVLREAAIKAGSKAAALNHALRLMMDTRGDHARAVDLLKVADAEEVLRPMARYGWGRAYLFGWGVERDMKKGLSYLEAFAKDYINKDAFRLDAEFLIGRAYQNGWDVPVDRDRAYRHMRQAAEMGDPRAQWHTGMMLLQGFGVARNEQEAYSFVKRSAEAGYEDGMISNAVMLATGEGVTENDAEARVSYLKAAERGSAHALRGLGMMLIVGEGGPAEVDRGFALLELAVEAREPGAIQLMPRLLAQAKPDRAAVDKAKADWVAMFGAPQPAT